MKKRDLQKEIARLEQNYELQQGLVDGLMRENQRLEDENEALERTCEAIDAEFYDLFEEYEAIKKALASCFDCDEEQITLMVSRLVKKVENEFV